MIATPRLTLRAYEQRDPGVMRFLLPVERLGMRRVADSDFDHPNVPDEGPLKRRIRYRIDQPAA